MINLPVTLAANPAYPLDAQTSEWMNEHDIFFFHNRKCQPCPRVMAHKCKAFLPPFNSLAQYHRWYVILQICPNGFHIQKKVIIHCQLRNVKNVRRKQGMTVKRFVSQCKIKTKNCYITCKFLVQMRPHEKRAGDSLWGFLMQPLY